MMEGNLIATSHSTKRWGSGEVHHTTTEYLDNHKHRLVKNADMAEGQWNGYAIYGDHANGAAWGTQWRVPHG